MEREGKGTYDIYILCIYTYIYRHIIYMYIYKIYIKIIKDIYA